MVTVGEGTAIIKSELQYNDKQWHKVTCVTKQNGSGYFAVDDQVLVGSYFLCRRLANHISKVYLGGRPTKETISPAIPKESQKQFIGRIKEVSMRFEPKGYIEYPEVKKGVTNEPMNGVKHPGGVCFTNDGGYLSIFKPVIKVGKNFSISFKIRVEKLPAYLFGAYRSFVGLHTRSDSLTIHINKYGRVVATCDNGGHAFSVEVFSSTICSKTTSISLEKDKKRVRLTVNGVSKQVEGKGGNVSVDNVNPVFLGGAPERSKLRKTNNFIGCMKDVKVNKASIDLNGNSITSIGAVIAGYS